MHVEIEFTEGPGKGLKFTFDRPDCFLFGRAQDARIPLTLDRYASRHHFLLTISPPHCKLTDLGSSNGTLVNGIRYGGIAPLPEGVKQEPSGAKEVFLRDGDQVEVGSSRMSVRFLQTVHLGNIDSTIDLSKNDRQASTPPTVGMPEEDKNRIGSFDPTVVTSSIDIPGYTIERELGRGGMGAVYKAREQSSDRYVAIKTMLPRVAVDWSAVKLFHREIETTRQLKHPNVVALLNHGTVGKALYCILEYVDGTDLSRYCQQFGSTVPLKKAAPIMLKALNGLAYAHRASMRRFMPDGQEEEFKGIVHRDIKPQNILISESGIVKIADFGLAKSFEAAGATDLTMDGETCGTPSFWPREQITHYRYLYPATDVFSLAAVFYKMLTGNMVRDGFEDLNKQCAKEGRRPGIADFMRVIGQNPVRPIRSRNSDIPEEIAQVIDRALLEFEVPLDQERMRASLAELRYGDAAVFRDAVAEAFRRLEMDVVE